ncbi:MAG: SGNH/GDSL hydrolase family protein [Anaerolineae bacterium]|nr:SGNH/GDSL hydrolase family protein [Anaerolineae bacterium]
MHEQSISRERVQRRAVVWSRVRALRHYLVIVLSMTFILGTLASQPSSVVAQGANPCVSVVGDSVAYGHVVFELAGYGYVVARFVPVSVYVEQAVRANGLEFTALDRSEPAVGLASSAHPSYFDTDSYQALLTDHCQYTVIIPWLNDLEGATADTHLAAMNQLIQTIQASNGEGKIIVINFYQGAPAPFAKRTFAKGLTAKNVAAFNAKLRSVCSDSVICLPASQAFAGLGMRYVAGRTTKAVFDGNLYAPLKADEQTLFNAFFQTSPRGSILGDGVHLSGDGKEALARAVARLIK